MLDFILIIQSIIYLFTRGNAHVTHDWWSTSEDVPIPKASMPGGLPMLRGRSPGVVLVPAVGASFLGVGVLDFRLGVDDLSF